MLKNNGIEVVCVCIYIFTINFTNVCVEELWFFFLIVEEDESLKLFFLLFFFFPFYLFFIVQTGMQSRTVLSF